MSNVAISSFIIVCLSVGFLGGMWLQCLLPNHHLSKESQDTIKLGAGMIATMSALVLGLLVSSAKNSFDTVNASIAQNGVRIIQLDSLLKEYGSDAQLVRDQLKKSVAERVQKIWSKSTPTASGLQAVEKSTTLLEMQSSLRALAPQTERERSLLNQALQLASEIWQSRLLIVEEQQEPLPTVFLVLLVFWLAMLFLTFGLFAPRNATVSAVMFVCAFSVSSALFLILEMSHPLDGMIKVSSAPLLKALELIGH